MEDSPKPLMILSSLRITKFSDAWRIINLSSLVLPFLLFTVALLMNLDAEFFHAGQFSTTIAYFITVAVMIKLTVIVEKLHESGKLSPIRFLLGCFSVYTVVILLLTRGFDLFVDAWFDGEFAAQNSQIDVLLMHTASLGLVSSLSFGYWVTKMIEERDQQRERKGSIDLNNVVKESVNDDADVADDYQVL
jgi:hypothetical protein